MGAITRSFKPQISELDQARQNLENRRRSHDLMKAANSILRKGGADAYAKLKELGLDQQMIVELQKPDFANRSGYKSFELRNNNAEIRRLETRVASLEARQHIAQT